MHSSNLIPSLAHHKRAHRYTLNSTRLHSDDVSNIQAKSKKKMDTLDTTGESKPKKDSNKDQIPSKKFMKSPFANKVEKVKVDHILRPVRAQMLSEISESQNEGLVFGYPPVAFSPIQKYSSPDFTPQNDNTYKSKFEEKLDQIIRQKDETLLKRFLRKYDIERIREERVARRYVI